MVRQKRARTGNARHDDERDAVPADNVVEDRDEDIVGLSTNPATNLVAADIIIRTSSYFVRRAVERTLLKGRYGHQTASDILSNRTKTETLAAMAASRLAAKSMPGRVIVGGGIALKILFDLSQKRRSRLRGEKSLAEKSRGEE